MYTEIMKLTTLILVLLCTCSQVTVALVQHRTVIRVSDYDNLYFNTNHIADLTDVASPTRCASFCERNQDCLAFFYNVQMRTCRLHQGAFFNKNEGTAVSNWRFYAFENKDCPTYYGFNLLSNGLCLHVATSRYSFNDGNQYCSSLNSRVVTLETTDKRLTFEDFIAKLGTAHAVWIGLLKTATSGWQWGSGNSLGQEQNWGIGQPFCPAHPCNCAEIILVWSRLWNDGLCSNLNTIICEYLP